MWKRITNVSFLFVTGCVASVLTADDQPVVRNFAVLSPAAWPSLKSLVPRCVLVVHCRTEQVDSHVLYRVLDVWKGEYSPTAFVRPPPEGYISTSLGAGLEERNEGREFVLFYTRRHQPKQGISRHDLALPVRDDKVEYPPARAKEGGLPPSLHVLADFKRAVKSLVEDKIAAPVQPQRVKPAPAAAQRDFAGAWRVILPAGFERAITLKELGENRYRLEPGNLTFSGVYEARGDRLVLVEPADPHHKGFEWTIRSEYLLSLSEQASNTGSDYTGAVMFRGKEDVRLGKR